MPLSQTRLPVFKPCAELVVTTAGLASVMTGMKKLGVLVEGDQAGVGV